MRRTLYFERMFPEMISRPDVGAFIHRATLQVTISAVSHRAFSSKCTLCIPFLLPRRVLTMTAQNKRFGNNGIRHVREQWPAIADQTPARSRGRVYRDRAR